MREPYYLRNLPKPIKTLLILFCTVMVFGYSTSMYLVYSTTEMQPFGIEENYLGNESDEQAKILKFEKSSKEMASTVHNHLFSLAMIILILSAMLYFTRTASKIKHFLMVEPMISLLITFGSMLLLWQGIIWMKYVLFLSGLFLHGSILLILLFNFKELISKRD